MKFFSLLFLILLIGCEPKEDKPELDFVKIDILAIQHHIPSSITIDFKSRSISFSDLTQMSIMPKDCSYIFEILKPSVDFEYIKLNETEFKDIKVLFGKHFVSDIQKFNTEYLKNKNSDDYIFGEGKRYRINFAKDSTKIATDDFLILDVHNQRKIYELLKIIRKHTKSTNNINYIEYFSFEYEESYKSTG